MTQDQNQPPARQEAQASFSLFSRAPLDPSKEETGQQPSTTSPAEPTSPAGHEITPQRLEILHALITHGQPLTSQDATPDVHSRQKILTNLDQARADDSCDCGTCPSFGLIYPGADGHYWPGYHYSGQDLPARTLTATTQDGAALLLAHIRGDYLIELEIAPTGDHLVTLPRASDLAF